MGVAARSHIDGNRTNPSAYILLEYCGGWGYGSKVLKVKQEINANAPNQYQFHCKPDEGTTGRFEITYFKTLADLNAKQNGTLFHSKKASGKFPFENEEFKTKIVEGAGGNKWE